MFDATNAKNRIDSLTNSVSDAKDTARDTATDALSHATELATGVPQRAQETFQSAFNEALAALMQYGSMTSRAYKSGFSNYEKAYDAMARGFRSGDPEVALEAVIDACGPMAAGSFDLAIGNGLTVPIKAAFRAGFTLVTSTVTFTALAELVAPILVTIALGYAALKLKDITTDKIQTMVRDALDNVPGLDAQATTDLDDIADDADVEVVELDDEATENDEVEAAIQQIQAEAQDALADGGVSA